MLSEGKVNGYYRLKSEIDRFRELSANYINDQIGVIMPLESIVEALRARESFLYMTYVFFNLLGLMITMCKDLPVWKLKGRGCSVT